MREPNRRHGHKSGGRKHGGQDMKRAGQRRRVPKKNQIGNRRTSHAVRAEAARVHVGAISARCPRSAHRRLGQPFGLPSLDNPRPPGDPRIHLLVLLGRSAGLRRGEIIALRWTDLDLKRRIIHVRRSILVGQDRKAHETLPKGAKGRHDGRALGRAPAASQPPGARPDHGRRFRRSRTRSFVAGSSVRSARPASKRPEPFTDSGTRSVRSWRQRAHLRRPSRSSQATPASPRRYMHLWPANRAAAIGLLDAAWTRPEIGETVEKLARG